MNAALLKAVDVASYQNRLLPLIVFLTDGQSQSPPSEIIDNVNRANFKNICMFNLAFGEDTDFGFLKKLSLQNNGFARKIYEGSDAASQIENFYDEISTPILSNVEILYPRDSGIDESTVPELQTGNVFRGSEMVVCGKVKDPCNKSTGVAYEIRGYSSFGPFRQVIFSTNTVRNLDCTGKEPSKPVTENNNFLERLWAYKAINNKLDDIERTDNEMEKKIIKEQTLSLCLRVS